MKSGKNDRWDKIKHKKILFAQSDNTIRDEYVNRLRLYFKDVDVADDGIQAYDKYKNKKYDLIIFDIDMPNMSGVELAKEIRKSDNKINLIVMSEYAKRNMLIKLQDTKIQRHLIKPLNKYTFDEEVYDVLYKFERKYKRINKFLKFDFINDELFADNKQIIITKKETLIFKTLISRIGKIYSDEELRKIVWTNKNAQDVTSNALKRMISSLRKKLGKHNVIKNTYSKGYYIDR